jgi:hypothetical protein
MPFRYVHVLDLCLYVCMIELIIVCVCMCSEKNNLHSVSIEKKKKN